MNRRPPLVMTAAVALPTAAAAFGLCRVFNGWSFLPAMLVATVAAHTAATATRSLRPLIGDTLQVALGVLVATWLSVGSATTFGLPTAHTWAVLGRHLSDAWTRFATEAPPVPARPGYIFIAAAAVWLAGWAADRLAFRYRTPTEAMLPSATIFVFVTLLTTPRLRLEATVAYGLAVGMFAVAYRAWHRPEARRTILAAGASCLVVALGLSTLIVTQTPGAQGAGAVTVRDLGRKRSNRTVISPLVDIRRRLVDQSETELMRVTADRPSYWRLMALDQFDGTVWSSNQRFDRAGKDLESKAPAELPATTLRQTFRIGPLDQPWVPAAFQARSITSGGKHLLWDPSSATLIVDRSLTSSQGLTYTVESAIPDADGAALQAATGEIPDDVIANDTALPANFPTEAVRIARAVTQGAETPYDIAIKLQDWFRETFHYSVDIPPGQSSEAILEFLRSRVGYCEQFAGSFAAMARSLGLPARVVVGFTPGTPSPTDSNTYVVRGRNAHAWPEVYIGGAGWVSFEPTPGRGDPQATRHTGVAPQQAGPGQIPEPAPTVPPTTANAQPGNPANPDAVQVVPPAPTTVASATPTQGPQASSSKRPSWLTPLLVVTLAPIALIALGALLVRMRRSRRHRRATTPAERVTAFWVDVIETSQGARIRHLPTDTHHEFTLRLRRGCASLSQSDLDELGALATRAAWAPASLGDSDATRASDLSRSVCTGLRRSMSRSARVRLTIDPWAAARAVRRGGYSSRWRRLRMRAWPLAR